MRCKVDYEWVCEEMDGPEAEGAEIVDCHFWGTKEKALACAADHEHAAVALVKHEYTDVDGEQGRGYAYLDADGNLPDEFDGDVAPYIPAKFRT